MKTSLMLVLAICYGLFSSTPAFSQSYNYSLTAGVQQKQLKLSWTLAAEITLNDETALGLSCNQLGTHSVSGEEAYLKQKIYSTPVVSVWLGAQATNLSHQADVQSNVAIGGLVDVNIFLKENEVKFFASGSFGKGLSLPESNPANVYVMRGGLAAMVAEQVEVTLAGTFSRTYGTKSVTQQLKVTYHF